MLLKNCGEITEERMKFSSVQFTSITQSRSTVCNPMDCSTPGFLSITNSQSLLKLMSIESVIRIRWPKYWSFSFSISPSNAYSGLISFRIDWFDLLAVQGLSRVSLSPEIQKASILWCSAFFMIQLSHPYMTTGKNHSFD